MTSFFTKCPRCGTMIVTGHPCPECRHSDKADDPEQQARGESLIMEYQRRWDMHKRNYTIYMLMMFGTGVCGLLSAWMWFRFIFLGDVVAAMLLVPLTIGVFVMGYLLKFAQTYLPTEVFCPSCNTRLDELGLDRGCCPGCQAQLR